VPILNTLYDSQYCAVVKNIGSPLVCTVRPRSRATPNPFLREMILPDSCMAYRYTSNKLRQITLTTFVTHTVGIYSTFIGPLCHQERMLSSIPCRSTGTCTSTAPVAVLPQSRLAGGPRRSGNPLRVPCDGGLIREEYCLTRRYIIISCCAIFPAIECIFFQSLNKTKASYELDNL